jgi:hypothetical protein
MSVIVDQIPTRCETCGGEMFVYRGDTAILAWCSKQCEVYRWELGVPGSFRAAVWRFWWGFTWKRRNQPNLMHDPTLPRPYHKGMRFRAKCALSVSGVICVNDESRRHFSGSLGAGEILNLEAEPPSWSKTMWLRPARYQELETVFVPEQDQRDATYKGYAIRVTQAQVGPEFEVVHANEAG